MSNLTERLFRVLNRHPTLKTKSKLAAELGCSRSMLYHYEQDDPPPPREVIQKLIALEVVLGIGDSTDVESSSEVTNDAAIEQRLNRRIPVLGWAHAGQATSYEEMAGDWVEWIPTDCRDPKAFAVRLEGDSMEGPGRNSFSDGDLLILMPSERVHNGCLAVIRMTNDGVLFRRIETRGETARLVPFNPRYEAESIEVSKISWAYPVWGAWTQVWKG